MFENIECEWPLFFAFLIIDGVFTNNLQQVGVVWTYVPCTTGGGRLGSCPMYNTWGLLGLMSHFNRIGKSDIPTIFFPLDSIYI